MLTGRRRTAFAAALLVSLAGAAGAAEAAPKRFDWTTESSAAKAQLAELQQMIESFQFGPPAVEAAQRIVAADPQFAMGHYYLSATQGAPAGQAALDEAIRLAPDASDGERRFIEAMAGIRNVTALNDPLVAETTAKLEALAADYPDERFVQVILGQLYQGTSQAEKARRAFRRCEEIGPSSPRAKAFLANADLLDGHYAQARASFEQIEKSLPKGSVPFAIRYGIAFSHLYESHPDDALASLQTYLKEYRDAGQNQAFPEVFIWNSMARINLENGRFQEAMKAYEEGFQSVPDSSLTDDQKTTWRGRLMHGRSRTLARMGRHEEAWAIAEEIKSMIEAGGEPAEQYWPAWHYLAGYLKLESDEPAAAVVHLEKADPDDPFQTLLLARAYKRVGRKDEARQAYERVVASENNGLERALAYPEARAALAS